MTPEQKKELEALNDAVMWQRGEFGFYPYKDKYNEAPTDTLMKYPQLYVEHFAEIQALKSGEWVLMPVEPTNKMLEDVGVVDGYGEDRHTADYDHIKWYKDMVEAKPNVKGEW